MPELKKLSFNIHYGEGSVSHGPFGVVLSDFKHESASRPLCGFWRIDDQQLDI
jgi:hypothetical protein